MALNDSFHENNSAFLMDDDGIYNDNDMVGVNQIDSEIKRLLLDEKDRSDQLKRYYEALKGDYARSQGEVLDLQTQLKNLIEDNKIMQEKYKSMLEKMQQELKKKQMYVEELKIKELDEVKLEKIKEELSQQIEIPYKDIVKQMEQELERLHGDCNKLRYENSFLKTSTEHEKNEFQALTQQFKLKHDVELNAIRKDRDILRQKLQEVNHTEASKLREILKENSQAKIKIKSLLEENDELRSKIERTDSHQNSLVRNNTKCLTDHQAKLAILESEKESLKATHDSLHKDIMRLNETIANNTRKIHDVERENITLKNYIEESKHNHKKELANMKLDLVKEKGEHNRTKELMFNQMEDLKTKLEICEMNLTAQKKQLDDKEREISKTMNTIHEENWTKISELSNEKLDLESRLQMLQKDLEYKISIMQADKDKNDEKVRLVEKQRDEIYRENNRLRTLCNENENIRSLLEREQERNHEQSKKLHKLETESATTTSLENELTEINLKLKNELTYYVQESQKSKEHLQRMKDEFESRLSDMRAQYIGEKSEYQLKLDDLQAKLRKTNSQMSEMKVQYDKRKSQYERFQKQIKTKSELIQARSNELKIREQALKNAVPIEVHNRVKHKLQDILKRHQDFRHMLFSSNNNVLGTMSYANIANDFFAKHPVLYENNNNNNNNNNVQLLEPDYVIKGNHHILIPNKTEIDQLTSRLDDLTQKQTDHLREIIESTNRVDRSIHELNNHSPIRDQRFAARAKSPQHQQASMNIKLQKHTDQFVTSSDSEDHFKKSVATTKKSVRTTTVHTVRSETAGGDDDAETSSESYEEDFDMASKSFKN